MAGNALIGGLTDEIGLRESLDLEGEEEEVNGPEVEDGGDRDGR